MSSRVRRKLLKNKLSRFRMRKQMYEALFPTAADRLWAVRNSMDMNQREFAEFCDNLSPGSISRIECGYSLPTGRTLARMAKSTGISADFLLGINADQRLVRQAERFLERAEEAMQEDPHDARKKDRLLRDSASRMLARA